MALTKAYLYILFEPLILYETLAVGIELDVKRMSFTVPYDEFGPEKVIIIKEPSGPHGFSCY